MRKAFLLMSWLMIIFLLLVHEIVLASLITTCEELTDTGLRGVSANVIQLPDGNRRMYYMGTGGMVSAISSDGINWIQESGQRLSPGENERMVTNPWVLYTNDGRFRMIYEGQDSNGNRRLYSAISTDGLNFTREGMVMGGTSVDINPQSNTIFLSVPTGLRLSDGSIRMYFVSDGNNIRSAISMDEGQTWTRDSETRITYGVDPAIFVLSSGRYVMFYTDWTEEYRIKRILYAESSDGLNFTIAVPFISENEDRYALIDPEVLYINNRYRLYFSHDDMQTGITRIYTCLLPQFFPVYFWDVPSDQWAYEYISAIYNAGITQGCAQDDPNTPENERRYCPDDNVTRGQMAAFIIRAKYGETFSYTTTPYFTDVPSTHTFFKYVQKLRDDGITAVSGTYDVNGYVTRGQMAAFIIRAKYGETFSYTTTPYFSDVPSTHNFFKYVQKLKDTGITAVTGTYYVDNNVTRAEMAAFLARAFLGME